MPTVNMDVLEESRRHQVVQKYEVYPLNTSDVEDYQIKLTELKSSVKEDVRIIQKDLLYQWVESKSNVWSKLDNLKAKTPQTIIGLCGNPSAECVDDGDNVFDDFISNEGYSWKKDVGNPIIDVGGVGAWDEKTIYSMALPVNISDNSIIKQGAGNDEYWLFYSGAGDTLHPNHNTSIGLSKSTDFSSPVKYVSNPVINRSSVGLGGAEQGISVFDIKYIGTKYYMFMLSVYSLTDFRISMMESTDLLNWTNFTDVLTSNYKDHSPYVIEDPNDNTKLIMYYAYQPNAGDQYYRIGRATANKSTPYTWTYDAVNNPILHVANDHRIYPYVEYNAGTYDLYFGKYPIANRFAVYKTSNSTDSSFSDSNNLIINYDSVGAWDDAYVSAPRKYFDDSVDWIYYCGRVIGANIYTGIGFVEWLLVGSLSDWDVTGGSVSATIDHPHTGGHGIKFPTTGASPYPESQNNCIGKNKIYEVWIYDDMITTANFMNTARLYDSAGHDPLIGIWIATSTTHYSYRAEGGAWTASAVARSLGWHKFQFNVKSSTTDVYIDGTFIFTENNLDEDNLNYFNNMGYTAGTGYADDYIVRKYIDNEPKINEINKLNRASLIKSLGCRL
jgi:hypothetical protein